MFKEKETGVTMRRIYAVRPFDGTRSGLNAIVTDLTHCRPWCWRAERDGEGYMRVSFYDETQAEELERGGSVEPRFMISRGFWVAVGETDDGTTVVALSEDEARRARYWFDKDFIRRRKERLLEEMNEREPFEGPTRVVYIPIEDFGREDDDYAAYDLQRI